MRFQQVIVLRAILLLGIALGGFALAGRAFAHGHIEVGDYELSIGFRSEPAIQGDPNGLDLVVTDTHNGDPVNGLEDSLRVEIIFGESRRELDLRPRFGQDGAYTADLLPTEAGDYTWHIFGEIAGTPVDVSMTSGPDTFSPVESRSALSFPDQGAEASAAARSASLALLLAGVAALLGLAGLILGYLGFRVARSA